MPLISQNTIWTYAGKGSFLRNWTPFAPWVARTAGVINILATPCATTPIIWAKAAWVSAPRLIYLKSKPFLQAEEAYRFLDKKCGTRGIVRRLAAALGLASPDFEPPPGIPGALWAGWKVAGDFALKAQWYFMIADRTTEFAYNWASLAYEYSGCVPPGDAHATGGIPGGVGFFDAIGYVGSFADEGHSGEMQVFDQYLSVSAGLAANASYSITLEANDLGEQPAPFETYLERNGVPVTDTQRSHLDALGRQQTSDFWEYDGSPTPGTFFRIHIRYLGFGSRTSGGCSFQGYGHYVGKKGLLFDP